MKSVGQAELNDIEDACGRTFPSELRAMYRRGVSNGAIFSPKARESDFAYIEFSTPQQLPSTLEWWGDYEPIAEDEFHEHPGRRLAYQQQRYGIPLWVIENTIVIDSRDGTVGRHDGEAGPAEPVADSLAEFFWHFTACGCLRYGGASGEHFRFYWSVVEDLVPMSIPPVDNLWLQHLDSWYNGDILALGPVS
ncbi:MAG: hypothetical protein ACLFVJ_21745 [Persicimonas sp.]